MAEEEEHLLGRKELFFHDVNWNMVSFGAMSHLCEFMLLVDRALGRSLQLFLVGGVAKFENGL